MIIDRHWRIVVTGLYLFFLGFLVGMLAQRFRFEVKQAAVIDEYDGAVRQWHSYLMDVEKNATATERQQSGDRETINESPRKP